MQLINKINTVWTRPIGQSFFDGDGEELECSDSVIRVFDIRIVGLMSNIHQQPSPSFRKMTGPVVRITRYIIYSIMCSLDASETLNSKFPYFHFIE